MESIVKELWYGNIIPQDDSRTNSKEMKELIGIWQGITKTSRKHSPMNRRRFSRSSMTAGESIQVSVSARYSAMHSNLV